MKNVKTTLQKLVGEVAGALFPGKKGNQFVTPLAPPQDAAPGLLKGALGSATVYVGDELLQLKKLDKRFAELEVEKLHWTPEKAKAEFLARRVRGSETILAGKDPGSLPSPALEAIRADFAGRLGAIRGTQLEISRRSAAIADKVQHRMFKVIAAVIKERAGSEKADAALFGVHFAPGKITQYLAGLETFFPDPERIKDGVTVRPRNMVLGYGFDE